MKKIIAIVVLMAAAVFIYFSTRPETNILDDPRLEKFTRIQAEFSIEGERFKNDSAQFAHVRDSILKFYDESEMWMKEIEAEIDKTPEKWLDVYDLIIMRTEYIRDSLLHKRPPPDDSLPAGPSGGDM